MNRQASLLLLFAAARLIAAVPDCASCHDDQSAHFKSSVHGGVACTDCHTSIRAFPHPDNVPKVDCSGCHSSNTSDVAVSVHAKRSPQPCLSCHGDAHAILHSTDPQSMTYPSNLPRTCGACHGDPQKAKQAGVPEVYSMYMDSIHGFALVKGGLLVAASCSSCHGSHKILNSKSPESKTSYKNIPSTCGMCHAGPERDYRAGIHGQLLDAGVGAPVCTDCHTAHQVSAVRTAAWQMKTTATCGGCHADQLKTYRDTFHAQVSALGFDQTARCWDCHRNHDILPASDPKSSIAPANLPMTCGKCHPGANKSFTGYDPHADSHDKARYPALHYSAVFMNLLLSSVLGFFALHTAFWFVRSRFDRSGPRTPPPTGEEPGNGQEQA